jgi:hypothetical protein
MPIVHIGGEASTSVIRQTLGTYWNFTELILSGLTYNASRDARGCERNQQNEAYVASSTLRTVEGEPFNRRPVAKGCQGLDLASRSF